MSDTIDDRFMDGAYYDGTVGECFTFERHDDTEEVGLISVEDGEEVERLDFEEFRDIQEDLYHIPDEAVEDPVGYFKDYVSYHTEDAPFDPGFMYADKKIEVVERE